MTNNRTNNFLIDRTITAFDEPISPALADDEEAYDTDYINLLDRYWQNTLDGCQKHASAPEFRMVVNHLLERGREAQRRSKS